MKQEDIDKLDIGDFVWTAYASWEKEIYGGWFRMDSYIKKHIVTAFSRFHNDMVFLDGGQFLYRLTSDNFFTTKEEAEAGKEKLVEEAKKNNPNR
jgi:hypothetical protein